MWHGCNLAVPRYPHHLHRVVDPGPPPVAAKIIQAGGHIGRKKIMKHDDRAIGRMPCRRFSIKPRGATAVIAIDKNKRPALGAKRSQAIDDFRT
jgi:hypothetical protein